MLGERLKKPQINKSDMHIDINLRIPITRTLHPHTTLNQNYFSNFVDEKCPPPHKNKTDGHDFRIKFSFYALCEKDRINKISPESLNIPIRFAVRTSNIKYRKNQSFPRRTWERSDFLIFLFRILNTADKFPCAVFDSRQDKNCVPS
jgi:hypothetical protein